MSFARLIDPMTWHAVRRPLDASAGEHLEIRGADHPLRYREVITGWRSDPAFRAFFIEQLKQAPWPAYRWETPPITGHTVNRRFEMVLIPSPSLDGRLNPHSFQQHFRSDASVVAFWNLGRDARLVVPGPLQPTDRFGHLGEFTRTATLDQQQALWKLVGEEVEGRLGASPLWVSTAGHGVAWLHVRLDDRPKYYSYSPFKAWPPPGGPDGGRHEGAD